MGILSTIIGILNDICAWFYELYLEAFYAGWPINTLADLFYKISTLFNNLAWGFYDFANWVSYVSDLIGETLSLDSVWSFIKSIFPQIEQLRDWFTDWWGNIWNEITQWWGTVTPTVLGWVREAKEYALTWVLSVKSGLDSLRASWDNFVEVTLPSLPNLVDIQSLIMSWFADSAPFWEGWQEVKTQVVEFINDPLQWFYDKLDSFFERFW